MLFKARALLTAYCFLALELLLVSRLLEVLFSSTFTFNNWVISSVSTCLLQIGLLFCISILLQYRIKEVFERVKNSLELLLDKNDNLSLEAFYYNSKSLEWDNKIKPYIRVKHKRTQWSFLYSISIFIFWLAMVYALLLWHTLITMC